jgi:DNA-binding transcriptional ArsR family regulator
VARARTPARCPEPASQRPDGNEATDQNAAGVPASFSDELLGLISYRMRIIGEPARMRILLLLADREASVQEVADELRIAHQSISKHLNVLYGAGVLSRTRAGSSIRYSIADYTALQLIELTRASIRGYVEELDHHANAAA